MKQFKVTPLLRFQEHEKDQLPPAFDKRLIPSPTAAGEGVFSESHIQHNVVNYKNVLIRCHKRKMLKETKIVDRFTKQRTSRRGLLDLDSDGNASPKSN